ncbi:hypothetical protein BH11ARM2_BH11ARM2_32830 [soil metagenome]
MRFEVRNDVPIGLLDPNLPLQRLHFHHAPLGLLRLVREKVQPALPRLGQMVRRVKPAVGNPHPLDAARMRHEPYTGLQFVPRRVDQLRQGRIVRRLRHPRPMARLHLLDVLAQSVHVLELTRSPVPARTPEPI